MADLVWIIGNLSFYHASVQQLMGSTKESASQENKA